MTFKPLRWFQSVHAKLFVVTGLVTTALTVMVAYSITANSRQAMENYTQNLAIQTAKTVETEIQERDPEFRDPRKIKEVLESLQGSDKSILRIDVFRAEGRDRVAFVTSSEDDEQATGDWKPSDGWRLSGKNNNEDTPFAERRNLVAMEETKVTGDDKESVGHHSTGSRIFLPISSPRANKRPIGLVRVDSDMEQWEVVWDTNLRRTYKILPPVLVAEFILLWVILSWLLNDPLKDITGAMARLEQGDLESRANSRRNDELGRIADRFNQMAAQLQRAASEREALIEEIRGLNMGLQERVGTPGQEPRTGTAHGAHRAAA
jgi:HAMP domain-containing protein